MNRTTIDYGIDLGTTNSAITLLDGVGTKIIKNNDDADITPSAVGYDRRGTLMVGQRAKNRKIDKPNDVYLEFKRRMGAHHEYLFESCGKKASPEELSAEVMKELKGAVQQRLDEPIEAAVITVPAAFELNQCEATGKAAELAGFTQSPLLQEPVAAALAYGFQIDSGKNYWMVFDFGGGTFDAAVIKAEEGMINVVNHGGDNFLGGSDIDWAMVEELILPKLLAEYDLQHFQRGQDQWAVAFAKLKRAAELARIDLSRRDKTLLEEVAFSDSQGKEIVFDCELTQTDLIRVAEPYIHRAVKICRRVLEEKQLSAEDMEKVVLVGGPTLANYFRDIIKDELGVQLDHSVDPLTVVAEGAAIFAEIQKLINTQSAAPLSPDECTVQLEYNPVGVDEDPDVGGTVMCPNSADLTGYTIEFVNDLTQWRGGKVPLTVEGKFMATLFAEQGSRNTYKIELCDPQGRLLSVNPNQLQYTIGAVIEEQPLCNTIGLALANNEVKVYFEKGAGLPLRKNHLFRCKEDFKHGQSGSLLRIPVIEGENDQADRNRLVGRLELAAENVSRDLPMGAEIEVTLRIDESRDITVEAYVPILDEEFIQKLNLGTQTPDADFLLKEYNSEMERFRESQSKTMQAQGGTAERLLLDVENSPLSKELQSNLSAAKGDPDAAAKCEKQLLELKILLDEAAAAVEWPARVAEAREKLEWMNTIVTDHGSPDEQTRAKNLTTAVEEAIQQENSDRLRKKIGEADRLRSTILHNMPEAWMHWFGNMVEERDKMSDQSRADQLINQGLACIDEGNIQGLKNVVSQMEEMLPRETVAELQRGYQSGLM